MKEEKKKLREMKCEVEAKRIKGSKSIDGPGRR